jgi:chloride channel 3/4/5
LILQAWLLLALVGCALGVCSSWVQLVWTWLDSLRSGYCIGNIFLHQAACCGCSVITGGSAISDSALHPPDPTAVFNNGTSNSVLEQLGSLDCQDFRSWTQVYMLWTHMQSSDTNGSTFWNGATPAYWFGYAVYVLSGALMAVLGVWLVLTYGKFARASGLPEIKTVLGGIVMRKFLGAWTLFIKMLGCVLAVGSGLVLGVEGPFIHIACCIANIATRFFPKFHVNEGKKREVFAAASAAGVAVAFGAPVGGVLFSLEELSSYFPHTTLWRSFFCAVVAIIAIAFADPLQTGELVWFKIGFRNSWSWYEMLPFCLIGVLGGLVGAAMIKLNFRVARFLDTTSWGRHPLIEVFFVAVFTNMLRFPFVLLRGSTYHFLSSLFSDCRHPDQRLNMLCDLQNTDPLYTAGMLAMFGLLMAIFVCISFGSWIPGGIYVPSLLIGACFGRAVGVLLAQFYQSNPASTIFYNCHADASVSCITPGIYAIVGAAAVLGGVTRMTVSLSVIMFELTGGLIYALPIFCAVMIAKWVGDAFSVDSIHDMYITLYDFPHLDHKINVPSTNITIGDVMAHDLFVLPMHGHTIESLRLVLDSVDLSGFPIVTSDDERLLVGYAARSELEVLLENASSQRSTTRCYFAALEMRFPKSAPFVDLSPCVDTAPMQVAEHMSFERVFHMFRTLGLGYCLITRAGKLIGVLTKKDILRILKTSS